LLLIVTTEVSAINPEFSLKIKTQIIGLRFLF